MTWGQTQPVSLQIISLFNTVSNSQILEHFLKGSAISGPTFKFILLYYHFILLYYIIFYLFHHNKCTL